MQDALIAVACVFAVVTGANDGSAILSAGLRVPGLRPATSLFVLAVAIVIGPWELFGTGVATTFAHRLVAFDGREADQALLIAAICSMAIVFALTRAGLPTSLTLALIGAVGGTALGQGLPLNAGVLVTILAVGIVAPVAAAVLAYFGTRGLRHLVRGKRASTRLRQMHVAAYCLQCFAYSANGGQKMLAVFALTVGAAAGGAVRDPWWIALSIAALFCIGVGLSIRRVAANVGQGIVSVHLRHAVVAETCSFALIMGAGLAGVPATMTQTLTGGIVGAGASDSWRRVRWTLAKRLVASWVVTLPASIGLATLVSALLRWL